MKNQLAAKNAEKAAIKERQLQEDLKDEERIRRELEELKSQYANEMKEDNPNKPPEPFDFQNIEKNTNKDNRSIYSKNPQK